MEKINSVQLGEKTDKKFLKGIIPDSWFEVVYEHEKFWACECKRANQDDMRIIDQEKQFEKIVQEIKQEFGDSFMEVYSITSAGIHFVVYLKK